MSRPEAGFRVENFRDVLFAMAQILSPGVYSLGYRSYLSVPLPKASEKPEDGTTTLKVFDFDRNILNIGESGWYAHEITIANRKRMGMTGMKRQLTISTNAVWDRGENEKPLELTGVRNGSPAANLDDYATRVLGITSGDRRPVISPDDPLGIEKIGHFVNRNIIALFTYAAKAGNLHSYTEHYESSPVLARGQHMPPDMEPDALEGEHTDTEEMATFPLLRNGDPVVISRLTTRFIDRQRVARTIVVPQGEGIYYTYVVDSSDMSLKRVVPNTRSRLGYNLRDISPRECKYVVDVLDFLTKSYSPNPGEHQ